MGARCIELATQLVALPGW